MHRCVRTALLATMLVATATAQGRSPCFVTVTGPDEQPIAGAEVTWVFAPDLPYPWPADVVTGTTDARGRASAELVVGLLYTAWVVGPPDAEGARQVSEPVPFTAAGRVLTLRAFDRRVPQAVQLVGVANWREVGAVGLRWFPDASKHVHVDLPLPDGDTVVLPPSPWTTGRLGLRSDAGDVMVTTPVGPTATTLPGFAAPNAVEAIVTDTDGKPLEGAQVTYILTRGPTSRLLFRSIGLLPWLSHAGTTGVDGIVRFHAPRPVALGDPTQSGNLRMFAGKTGFERQLQEISGPGKVSFRLRPTSTTHLHLVDVDAAPVQSAMLGYYRTERTYLAGQPVLEVERAAPFEWLVPVPGTGFTPRFLLQGSVPSAVVGDWFADPPAELKIDLATPTKVEVRVLDPDGNPAPAALGTARITEGFLINWESALATDVAGRAALWLPSPKFYVYATAGTAHALALVQEATDTILSLRLEPLPTMHVRVIDADGKPVAGARAAAHEGSQGSLSRDPLQRQWDRLASGLWWSYAAMARSGADGVLEIPVFVRDGFEAKVQVYAGSQRSPAFVLRPGGETEVTVLRN